MLYFIDSTWQILLGNTVQKLEGLSEFSWKQREAQQSTFFLKKNNILYTRRSVSLTLLAT